MRYLLLACLLLVGCSPSYHLYVGNTSMDGGMTRGPVDVTLAGQTVKVEGGSTMALPLAAGTIRTQRDGKQVEEVPIPTDAKFKDKNIFYNVEGKGNYYVVDYSGCYQDEETGKKSASTPIKVLAQAKGKKLVPVPLCHAVLTNERLPAHVEGKLPVIRFDDINEAFLQNKSIDQALIFHFSQEMRYRDDVKH